MLSKAPLNPPGRPGKAHGEWPVGGITARRFEEAYYYLFRRDIAPVLLAGAIGGLLALLWSLS